MAFPLSSLEINWAPSVVLVLIGACICTSRIGVSINGEIDGFFHPERGLHQGCPYPRTYLLSAWKSYIPFSAKLRAKGFSWIEGQLCSSRRLTSHVYWRSHDFQGGHCQESRDHITDPRHLL